MKAIPWLEEVFEVSQAMYSVAGRKLADMPRRMGYEIREVEDSRYGSVKAYHTDVIKAFRHALKADRNGNDIGVRSGLRFVRPLCRRGDLPD